MKVSYIAATILLAASLSASAAVINHTDAFATSIGDTAGTEAAHFLSYTDTDPTPAASPSEIRTQDGPFNNGGTLFLAALENEAQSATYLASNTGLGADVGDGLWDTSSALTLTADFANNWGTSISGFMLEGTANGLIVSWEPGGTTYSAGVSTLTTTPPSDIVSGSTFAGAATAPAGTVLAAVTLSLVENGANYDFTLTMGGESNTFSVAKALLGDVSGIGFYNKTDPGIGGNTNIDNVQLTGTTLPEPPGAPVWLEDPIAGDDGYVGIDYVGTLAGKAQDPNGDPITYSRDASGPAWLNVATNGVLSGTPTMGDLGTNTFVVIADDEITGSTNAVLNIYVSELVVPDIVLIDNTNRNGSFELETGKVLFIDGAVSFWENWSEVDTADNDTGCNDANTTANTYVGLDGTRMAFLQPGAAILNMSDHIIEVGDVIDYSFWSARTGGKNAQIQLVWDNAGTRTAITGTEAVTGTGGAQAEGQFTVQAGDPWIGSTLGVGLTPIDAWPEIDQVALGVTPKPAAAVTDLSISGPVSGGAQMVLTWISENGGSYGVETNSNLPMADWQSFTNGVAGDGGMITITNAIGPDQTFYRVITE